MVKSIILKEWLKMRVYLIFSLIASLGIIVYLMLNIRSKLITEDPIQVIGFMLGRDIIFVDMLQFFPLFIGILLSVIQWLPEMIQKRIKLTLHLPVHYYLSIGSMLMFGLGFMLSLSLLNILAVCMVEMQWFPFELVRHTIMTLVLWYLAGIAGYLLCSWVILEPTWKMRIVCFLISVSSLAVFYLSSQPEVYNKFLPILILATCMFAIFPIYSVYRFKIGKGI